MGCHLHSVLQRQSGDIRKHLILQRSKRVEILRAREPNFPNCNDNCCSGSPDSSWCNSPKLGSLGMKINHLANNPADITVVRVCFRRFCCYSIKEAATRHVSTRHVSTVESTIRTPTSGVNVMIAIFVIIWCRPMPITYLLILPLPFAKIQGALSPSPVGKKLITDAVILR
jgi:hypothetical protein